MMLIIFTRRFPCLGDAMGVLVSRAESCLAVQSLSLFHDVTRASCIVYRVSCACLASARLRRDHRPCLLELENGLLDFATT